MNYLLKQIVILFFAVIFLNGCTSSAWNRTPPPSHTEIGAVIGTIGGVAVGSAAGGIGVPLGAAIGGIWGGAIGSIIQSHQTLVQRLLYNGVQIIRVGDGVRLILPSDRFFFANSANLRTSYKPVLFEVAEFIRAFKKIDIRIAAYTDSQGSDEKNWVLSQNQAKTIAYWLWRKKIEARIMYARGYGAKYPIDDNSTLKGQANNRRIEITFNKIEPDILV